MGETPPIKCGDETTLHRSAVYPVQELNHFTLQLDLSHQLTALTLLTIGVALYNSGKFESSIDHLTQSLSAWGKEGPFIEATDTYFWRGDAYLANGEYMQAIADFSTVLSLKPDFASAYNNRGNAYKEKGDFERALADYTEVIRLGTDICLACAYMNRGNLYADQGDYQDAMVDYTSVIRVNPTFADAYDSRGHARLHLGQFDQAFADINHAIKLASSGKTVGDPRGIMERDCQSPT
jgi:tetratricopeptide (TPR) repeat protein